MKVKTGFKEENMLQTLNKYLIGFTLVLFIISLKPGALTAGNPWDEMEFWQPLHAKVSYTTPYGVGRNVGYTSLAAYYCPEFVDDCFSPYVDVRLHYLNNHRWAGNFGFGFQKPLLVSSTNTLLRGYVFYDFRNSSFRLHEQICAGAEWFGPSYDVRLNTYFPIFQKGHAHYGRTHHFEGGFRTYKVRNEYAWRGFDLEFSKYLTLCDKYCFYASAGPYFFHGRSHNTFGGKIRLESEIYNGVMLALQGSYDHHFGGRAFAQVSWAFPLTFDFSGRSCCFPVQREELIVLSRHCHWHKNY